MASAGNRESSFAQGNWISPDPAGLAAVDPMNPQTWNRYAYVANNPTSATDPTGLMPCDACDWGGGGGGWGDWGDFGYVPYDTPDGGPGYCGPEKGYCGDPGIDVGIGIGIGGGGGGGRAPAASSGGTAHPRPPLTGETNGIPSWLHVQPLNLAQLLGIEPVGGWCDFGPCSFGLEGADIVGNPNDCVYSAAWGIVKDFTGISVVQDAWTALRNPTYANAGIVWWDAKDSVLTSPAVASGARWILVKAGAQVSSRLALKVMGDIAVAGIVVDAGISLVKGYQEYKQCIDRVTP